MEIIISSFRLKSPRNWGRQSGIFQSKSLLQFGRMSFCETSCAWHHYGGRCTLHSSKHASTTIWQFLKMHKLTYLILVWLKIGETMAYGIPSKYQFYLNRRKDDMPMDSGFSPQFSDKLIWQLPRACDQSPIPFSWKYKVCSLRILQFLQGKSHVARPTNLCRQSLNDDVYLCLLAAYLFVVLYCYSLIWVLVKSLFSRYLKSVVWAWTFWSSCVATLQPPSGNQTWLIENSPFL